MSNASCLQITSSMRLVFSEVTYAMVISVDRLMYEVLDMINRHARITFKQEGTAPSTAVPLLCLFAPIR